MVCFVIALGSQTSRTTAVLVVEGAVELQEF